MQHLREIGTIGLDLEHDLGVIRERLRDQSSPATDEDTLASEEEA